MHSFSSAFRTKHRTEGGLRDGRTAVKTATQGSKALRGTVVGGLWVAMRGIMQTDMGLNKGSWEAPKTHTTDFKILRRLSPGQWC